MHRSHWGAKADWAEVPAISFRDPYRRKQGDRAFLTDSQHHTNREFRRNICRSGAIPKVSGSKTTSNEHSFETQRNQKWSSQGKEKKPENCRCRPPEHRLSPPIFHRNDHTQTKNILACSSNEPVWKPSECQKSCSDRRCIQNRELAGKPKNAPNLTDSREASSTPPARVSLIQSAQADAAACFTALANGQIHHVNSYQSQAQILRRNLLKKSVKQRVPFLRPDNIEKSP